MDPEPSVHFRVKLPSEWRARLAKRLCLFVYRVLGATVCEKPVEAKPEPDPVAEDVAKAVTTEFAGDPPFRRLACVSADLINLISDFSASAADEDDPADYNDPYRELVNISALAQYAIRTLNLKPKADA